MRQGLLSEPEASSGPATMLLAVSRSPSSIPRTESLPGAMPPPSGVPQPHPPLKISKTSPPASTPGPMPPFSGVPLHPPHKTAKTSPPASTPRSDATFLWRPSPSQQKKRHPAVPTLPDTETKTPVKQTYTIYNQHSLSAQLNYHQKVLSATQDRWPAL